jgi:hypothetical protein
MIDTLLLSAARISTFEHERGLTHASGFFFEREGRLFLVTSRHVLIDEPTKHHPNRIEIEIHTSDDDLARPRASRCCCLKTARACGARARTPAARSTWR